MENSGNQYSNNHITLPHRHYSDSELQLKLKPVNCNDADADLRIIGFKVQLNDNETYTFTLDKARSRSEDVLRIVADSSDVISQQITEARPVDYEAIRDFLITPPTSEVTVTPSKCQATKSKITINEEGFENSSALKLKFSSNCLENNKIEVHIKSSNESFCNSSINKQLCINEGHQEKDQIAEVVKICPGRDGSHSARYLKESWTAPLEQVAEITSTEVQPEEGTASASNETTEMEAVYPKSQENARNQSENICEVLTEIREKVVDLAENVTNYISTKQSTVQPGEDTAFMHLQTENGDIFSIEKEHGASTQTKQTEDVATSTDFNCYLVDKICAAEKPTDTEGLPFGSLIVTKKEKAEMEDNQREANCRCSCEHQELHDCIYRCCSHTDNENKIPTGILLGQNLRYLTTTHSSVRCNFCRCRLNSCSESTNNCVEKLKSDIHPQFCCKCATNVGRETSVHSQTETTNYISRKQDFSSFIASTLTECIDSDDASTQTEQTEKISISTDLNCCLVDGKCVVKMPLLAEGINAESETDSNPSTDEIKELEKPESIKLEPKNFDLLAKKEKNVHLQQVEIVQSLDSLKEKEKICVATKVFKRQPKIDKVSFLQMPVFFEHCLNSFSLSKLGQSKIVINPIDITLDEKVLQENVKLKPTTKAVRNGSHKNGNKRSHSPISSETEEKCMKNVVSLNLASCYSNSQVCPCSMGHPKTEIDQKKENNTPKHSSDIWDKEKSLLNQLSTSSPKIKPEEFDYMSKDGWKPYIPMSDEFVSKKIEPIDVINLIKISDEDCFDSFNQSLKDACEIVNDHLLSLRPVDGNAVRKAAEMLHKRWFEVAGNKYSDVLEVRHYVQYFQEFSNNLVKSLLHSADINGNNVLHFAFANNKFDLVDEFLQNGYALELLNKGNKFGNTPLMVCAISKPEKHSDWTVIRKCLEFSDVNQKTTTIGQTPLMNAASCGFQAMVDLLLDIGANPNLQDVDGSTALMYAAEHGHEKCVKSLVRHKKCDPTIRDKDGETACSIALSNGHKNVAVLIHMQALEKRRLWKNPYSTKRLIWTSNNKTARKKSLAMMPLSTNSDVCWGNH